MEKASRLLPSTIEEATKGTPIQMLMKVVDKRNIEAFLAIELTKLQSLINVDERLNLQAHQIPFIASQLIDLYKNESLADFKICFQRGAMGRYDDKLLRLDAAVIANWMRKYLEEKYQVIEDSLMKAKDNPYETVRTEKESNGERRNLLAALESVVHGKDPGIDLSKYLKPEELEEYKAATKSSVRSEEQKQAETNAYEMFKAQRAKQQAQQKELNRFSTEFYRARGGHKEIKQFEDDNGFYVLAETEDHAKEIYNDWQASKL